MLQRRSFIIMVDETKLNLYHYKNLNLEGKFGSEIHVFQYEDKIPPTLVYFCDKFYGKTLVFVLQLLLVFS